MENTSDGKADRPSTNESPQVSSVTDTPTLLTTPPSLVLKENDDSKHLHTFKSGEADIGTLPGLREGSSPSGVVDQTGQTSPRIFFSEGGTPEIPTLVKKIFPVPDPQLILTSEKTPF